MITCQWCDKYSACYTVTGPGLLAIRVTGAPGTAQVATRKIAGLAKDAALPAPRVYTPAPRAWPHNGFYDRKEDL